MTSYCRDLMTTDVSNNGIQEEDKKSNFKLIPIDKFLINNKSMDFIITDSQIKETLSYLGNRMDDEGYLIDENNLRIKLEDNESIRYDDIGAILPCCKRIIRKDIGSYIRYLMDIDERE